MGQESDTGDKTHAHEAKGQPKLQEPAPGAGRVRLADVARRAGVSLGSASQALRHPALGGEGMRLRVEAAAQELGYVPDGRGRALAMGRSALVGVVLPVLHTSGLIEYVSALQGALAEQGYDILVVAQEFHEEDERMALRRLRERGVEAVAMVGPPRDASALEALRAVGLPCVLNWAVEQSLDFPCVGFSESQATSAVVDHLAELGHSSLAIVTGGHSPKPKSNSRLAGLSAACAHRGLVVPADAVFAAEGTVAAGRRALLSLLRLSDPPTAVVCHNDAMAAGLVAAAFDVGLEVPSDLSVVGFDNSPLGEALRPGLTSVDLQTAEIGRRTAAVVLEAVRTNLPARTELVAAELVVRGTTSVPARRARRLRQARQASD